MVTGISLTKTRVFNGGGSKSPREIITLFKNQGLATPSALEKMASSPKSLARFYALFHVNPWAGAGSFASRFKQLKIEGLDRKIDPSSSFFGQRFMLEKMGCAFAYHQTRGLTIVTAQERGAIARGELPYFYLTLATGKPTITHGIVVKPIKSTVLPDNTKATGPLPGTGLVPAEGSDTEKTLSPVERILGKLAPNRLSSTYSQQLTERILWHLENGKVTEAALLLFRNQTAAHILAFIEKHNIYHVVAKKLAQEHPFIQEDIAYSQLREVGLAEPLARELGLDPAKAVRDATENISSLLTETEAVLSYLLLQIEPPLVRAIFSAHFIESLMSKKNAPSACRILWGMGRERHEGKRVIYYVLSALLLRGQKKLAHAVIKEGFNHLAFHPVYAEALDDLQANLHPGIYRAEEYQTSVQSSLFKRGGLDFPLERPGLIPLNSFYRQALLAPRMLYREITRQLCMRGDYKRAWLVLGEGLEPDEIMNELLQTFPADPAVIGKLIHAQGRPEAAAFTAQVYKALPETREALAKVLLCLYEDKRDLAAFFVYLIRPASNIKEKQLHTGELREAAYGLLFLGATAFEAANETLQDEYISLLLEIERRYHKSDPDFLSAETFLKEGRLVKSDPPSLARKERLAFYFQLLEDASQNEPNRIYAAAMLTRMGGKEYFLKLHRLLKARLKHKENDRLSMHLAETYLCLAEELDPQQENKTWKKAVGFLLAMQDRFMMVFTGEEGEQLLGVKGEKKEHLAERFKRGKDAYLARLFDKTIAAAEKIRDHYTQYKTLARIASALSNAGDFDRAIAAAEKISDHDTRSNTLARIAIALVYNGRFNKALIISRKLKPQYKTNVIIAISHYLNQSPSLLDQRIFALMGKTHE